MRTATQTTTTAVRHTWWLAPFIATAIISILLTQGTSRALGAASGSLPCTTSPSGNFDLTTTTGYIHIPDGNSLYMWSYAVTGAPFQYPGPILCVNEGQQVTITLHNTLLEPTSLVFPGQEGVLANGSPSQPEFSGPQLVSLAPTAPAFTGTATYSFRADRPGTFIYESGTDQGKQVEMGLASAIVVRPAGHPNWAYDDPAADETDGLVPLEVRRTRTQFNPASEKVMILSMVDPALHLRVQRSNRTFDVTTTKERYFLINGRSFPDTIAPDNDASLPGQPYGSLFRLQPYVAGDASSPWHNPGLVRYLNVSQQSIPFHPHGNHGRVTGRDGHELVGASNADLSYEKFTVVLGPGQTVDATYTWSIVEPWIDNNTPTLSDLVTLPSLQDLTFKGAATYYGGSPILGQKAPLPVGTTTFNQCGEYYHMMHSHALLHVTDFGVSGGGMLTLMRIDPPGGCP